MKRIDIINQKPCHQIQEDGNAPPIIQNFILKHIEDKNIQLISCHNDCNEAPASSPLPQSTANFSILRLRQSTEGTVKYDEEEEPENHVSPTEGGAIRINEQDSSKSEQSLYSSKEEKNPVGLTAYAYSCFKCNEEFVSLPLLRKHLKTHRLVKHFNCTKCPEGFNIENNLEIHMLTQHPEAEIIDVCPICKIQFQRKASLKSHVMLHQLEELVLCDECEAEFQHEDELLKHMESHVLLKIKPESQLGPLTCKYCTMDCETLSQYKQHIAKHVDVERNVLKRKQKRRKKHTATKKISSGNCRYCKKFFPKYSLLIRHERIHTGEKPYKCQYCGMGFSQSNSLMSHLYRHTGFKPFACTLCPAKFGQKGNLRSHVVNTHTVVNKRDRIYKCIECTCIFSTLSSLNGHITRTHTNKIEEEEETGESMIDKVMNSLKQLNNEYNPGLKSNKEQNSSTRIPSPPVPGTTIVKLAGNNGSGSVERYAVRQKMIDDVRWYFCSYCSRCFKKPSDLFKHFNVHTLDKPFACSKCNQSFALKTTLSNHEKIHKKFGCNWKYCDNTNNNTSLLRNSKKHSAYYVCLLCHETFQTLQEMKMHQLAHQNPSENIQDTVDATLHQETPGNSPEPTPVLKTLKRPYFCKICNSKFTRPASLRKHMLYHTGEKFNCTLCPKSFVAKHRFNEHLNSHKNLNSFVCEKCGNKFGTPYLLKRHAKVHTRFKEFMCPYCDRQFKSEKLCRLHLKKVHQEFDIKVEKLKTPRRFYENSIQKRSDETKPDLKTMTRLSEAKELLPEKTDHESPNDFTPEQSGTLLLNLANHGTQEPYEIFYLNIGNNGEILQENLLSNGIIIESLGSLQEPTPIANEIQQSPEQCKVANMPNGQQEISMEQFSAVDLGTLPLPINLIETTECSVLQPNLMNNGQIPNDAQIICINCHKLFPGYDEFQKHVCRPEAALMIDKQMENNDVKEMVNNVAPINNDTIIMSTKDEPFDKDLIVIPAKSTTEEISLDQTEKSSLEEKLGPQAYPPKQTNQSYNCPCCTYFTKIEDNFRKHVASHPDWTDQRMCKFCFKNFRKPSDLKRHLRTHTGERPFECGECHRKFTLKSTLDYHLKTHNLAEAKGHSCVVCNTTFLSKSSLRVHMMLHTGERPYECKYCKQTFRTVAICHTHEKNVHVRKINSRANSSKPKLGGAKLVKLVAEEVAEKVRKEIGIAPASQKIQPQTHFIVNNLSQSSAVTLDPVFLMEQIRNSDLVIENPGSVPINLNDFELVDVQLDNNNSIGAGQEIISEPEKSSKIECDICHKMYASKDVLRKHKRKLHGQNRKFPCIKCDKGYDTLEELNCHIAKLHSGLRPYACQYCSNSFSEESSLKTHIIRIHKNLLNEQKSRMPILDLFSTASDFM